MEEAVGSLGSPPPAVATPTAPPAASPAVGAPSAPGASGVQPSGINLDEVPEFRQWKSTMDRRMSDAQRQTQVAAQEAQTQRQQYEALRQQIEASMFNNMDESAQLEYKLQMESQQRQGAEGRLAQLEAERQRNEFVANVVERYGIDPTQDEAAMQHPVQAAFYVAEKQHEKIKSLESELTKLKAQLGARESAAAERPDLGNGSPVTLASELQSRFNTAMLKGDAIEADRISRQAATQKASLDRLGWLNQRNQSAATPSW